MRKSRTSCFNCKKHRFPTGIYMQNGEEWKIIRFMCVSITSTRPSNREKAFNDAQTIPMSTKHMFQSRCSPKSDESAPEKFHSWKLRLASVFVLSQRAFPCFSASKSSLVEFFSLNHFSTLSIFLSAFFLTGHEDLTKNHRQEPKLNFLIKAIYTLAYGLQTYHEDVCGKDFIGACPQLSKSFNHSRFFVSQFFSHLKANHFRNSIFF